MNHKRPKEISATMDFIITIDLGKYLEIPIHHKWVSKESFGLFLDDMSQRLNSWKVITLLLVKCIMLTKAMLIAILQ